MKICIRDNEIEEIITILQTRLQKEENGDLFYSLSQVYKHIGNFAEYVSALQKALENHLTLTYQKEIVKKELDYMQRKYGIAESSNGEYEEYDGTYTEEEDDEEEMFDETDEIAENEDEEEYFSEEDEYEDDEE